MMTASLCYTTENGAPAQIAVISLGGRFVLGEMMKHKIIRNNLDELVKSLGKSRRKVAEECGVNQQTFNEWCANRRQLPPYAAKAIEERYGVPAAYVIGFQDSPECEVKQVTRYIDVECSYDSEAIKEAKKAINEASARAATIEHRLNRAVRLISQARR